MLSLLHQYFDRAAARWPDAVAIDVPPGDGRPHRQQFSYRALDAAAAGLAARLSAHVHGETIVAILAERASPGLIAAQLAVLRAGAAFTCVDPAVPDGQLRELLDAATPAAIVADGAAAVRLGGLGIAGPIVDLGTDSPNRRAADPLPNAEPPPSWLSPASLAYVIYTSGTSGRPKGVLIEHHSIANLVAADLGDFGLAPDDRVAQGSSAAYDSSIEETWLALAAGATVVVADDATVRLGPDLIRWLADERITVFCPPPTLLRSTGCEDPARALPHLRLLYVGGEALPPDVAERWAPGRHLVNGYGPTETTVTVVRERVTRGTDIAIGQPIAGVTAHVLDDDGGDAPVDGPGELCIGGAAVARGYRNQPALTATRFVQHPVHGRIYRTGDLATRGADGRLYYRGRLDAQVKLRGYRIELEAIEARLAACDGVAAAAAAVQGDGAAQRLVAFVVARDRSAGLGPGPLLDHLRAHLPIYMVPAGIGVLDVLPTTVGGKLDRAALPRLADAADAAIPRVAARTPVEAVIAAAMQAVLQRPQAVSVHDDFFTALGGDSLAAGLLVSRLRQGPDTAGLATRDVYEARTTAGLAARVRGTPADAETTALPALASTARVVAATAVQTAWLLGELAVVATLAWLVVARLVPWIDARAGLAGIVLGVPVVLGVGFALWTPIAVVVTALTSRLLLGRCGPGRAPAWGSVHMRLWIVQRLAAQIPWGAMAGTHALTMTLRVLGARVGHHVHVHDGVDLARGAWHLLTLGHRVSLARDASLRTVELHDGHLEFGPIVVADGATLDVHAGVGPGAHVGAGASLGPWTSVGAGVRVPDGERWEGVPAARVGQTSPAPQPDLPGALGAWTHAGAIAGAHALAAAAYWVPALAAILAVLAWLDLHDLAALRAVLWSPALWLLSAAGCMAALTLGLIASAAMCRAAGAERAGVAHARSWTDVRVEFKTTLLDAANTWLSGSLLWPLWLRAAGMRLGHRAEVSTIIDTVPDLVTIGDESFLADGIYLGGPRVDRGTLTLAPVAIGSRVFVGNHAVIGPGARLADDTLLGVCTVATSAMAIAPGGAWLGHPPMPLPRPRAAADRGVTHEPSLLRRLNRLLWESARLLLPVGLLLVAAWWLERLLTAPDTGRVIYVSAATAVAAAALALVSVVLKWLLLGRVRPGTHPLWSCWCSRWDFLYVAWGLYVPWFVGPLEGTLWLSWYLRAMGMSIGRRVLLGPGFAQVVDPDMVTIGDGATVHAMFQAHTFEDRMLKTDRVHIGRGATVAPGAVPLYGTSVGEGAVVAAHSVVMKGESLAPHTAYEGAPVAVAAGGRRHRGSLSPARMGSDPVTFRR